MKLRYIFIILFAFTAFVAPVSVYAQPADGVPTNPPASQPTAESPTGLTTKLQIPLPFIKTDCLLTDSNNAVVKDEQGNTIKTVCNLSDYIEGMYRLLIGLAALFAVVMIIIAGYQWIFAGGSADKTGSAKKRIFGAVIGLVLALLSYVILNAITPRLVALRLPEVPPVPPFFGTQTRACNSDDFFRDMLGKQAGAFLSNKDKRDVREGVYVYDVSGPKENTAELTDTQCGSTYAVISRNAGSEGKLLSQCAGVGGCPGSQTCTAVGGGRYECQNTLMYGNITWEPDNGYIDYLELYPICNNDDPEDFVADLDVREKASAYKLPNLFSVNSSLESKPRYEVNGALCRNGLKGYALKVEVNNDCYSFPVDDDDFAIGRSCNSPITTGEVGDLEYGFDDIDWNEVNRNLLFQPDDFAEQAYVCNLTINREDFPTVYRTGTNALGFDISCPTQNNEQ